MSLTTKARYAALRETILDVMERQIGTSGLSGLGMRSIAKTVGCSPGMIYKIGVDQDGLILMVNARTLDAIGARLRNAVTAADRPQVAMRNMALAYVDYAQEQTPRWDALFSHRMADERPVPTWYARKRDAMFQDLAAVVARAVEDASIQQRGEFSRMLFSAVHGVVTLGLQQKIGRVSPAKLRQQVRDLVDVMAAGLSHLSRPEATAPQSS
ncbi:TetR/AcrR family transcriptional regulator [Lichenicoccus roseus]|uniref:TetR/AcrR family transcriptional regulator n=1 Tax=Lichenicoccus roseus TaxID=2683649 RepID=A0A5R9J5L3_9PROT|nr:TetR/AcrR family transcriptional regulator [Lichenicoccus roseus]TLU70646.1 TetR/AcrR family transcriptional regulator [Lichenicoccus roseus]